MGKSKLYSMCLNELFAMVYSNPSLEILIFGDLSKLMELVSFKPNNYALWFIS